jgi:hypothetical protein
MTGLSYRQEQVLALAPIVPSVLSLTGSSTIVYLFVHDENRDNPYKRIILGISCCDILYSGSNMVQSFLLPAATSTKAFAFGNQMTCTISGTMWQFGISQVLYYGMLSYYFYFTIQCGWSPEQFARTKMEPWVHGIAIGFPLVSSIALAILGTYDELDLDNACWIDNYPKNCEMPCAGVDGGPTGPDDHCEQTCWSPILGTLAAGVWFAASFLSILVINVRLVLYVRRTLQRSASRTLGNGRGQKKRMQNMATQGFLYVAVFFCSYAWTLTLQIMEAVGGYVRDENGNELFALLFLQQFARYVPYCCRNYVMGFDPGE